MPSENSSIALERAKAGLVSVVVVVLLYVGVELWALRPVLIIAIAGLYGVMLND